MGEDIAFYSGRCQQDSESPILVRSMFLTNITTRLLVVRFLPFPFMCSRVKSCGEKQQHFSVIMIMMIITGSKIYRMIGDVRGSSAEGGPLAVDDNPFILKLQSSRWFRSSESALLQALSQKHCTHTKYHTQNKHTLGSIHLQTNRK